MFSWAITILILAVMAAVLAIWGFTGLPKWLVFVIAVVFA
jgi:hypothetical protein